MDQRHTRLRASLDRLKHTHQPEEGTNARLIREEQQRIDADKAAWEESRPDYDGIAHARADAGLEPY